MDTKKAIEESLEKLKAFSLQRDDLERQIGRLHLAVRALCNLVEDKTERAGYKAILERFPVRVSVADLVLLAFHTFDTPLTPVEIRNFIQNYGSEAGAQTNLLQSVHSALKRLEDADRIRETTNADGEKAYRYVSLGERLAGSSAPKATVRNLEVFERMLASKGSGLMQLSDLMKAQPIVRVREK